MSTITSDTDEQISAPISLSPILTSDSTTSDGDITNLIQFISTIDSSNATPFVEPSMSNSSEQFEQNTEVDPNLNNRVNNENTDDEECNTQERVKAKTSKKAKQKHTKTTEEICEIVLDKPEEIQTHLEQLIYNYYANDPITHIVLEPEEHHLVYKWALYALANTEAHDSALYQAGLDANHIRTLLDNCQRIKPKEYFKDPASKDIMRTWLNTRVIEQIPEWIPYDCIHYYTMSPLLLDSSLSSYDLNSDRYTVDSDGYYWIPMRAIYTDPADDIVYSAVFMVKLHVSAYMFIPQCSESPQPVIGLDMPEHNSGNPGKFTEISGGVLFRRLSHLYLGVDDIFSIGADFGYARTLAACERANWHGLFS